ncbi:MAG: NUDIX domain-containing protein [Immundisolibacter sp.]|uniref:NUDIX domain-containing protein n=1 Tax=Immundisolibacter sp. TaxID=1934948 RepID=UPI003EE25AD8
MSKPTPPGVSDTANGMAFDRGRDIEVLARDTVYQGYFRIDRYRLRHRLFNGCWSRPIQREVFERGHAAAVLPYDPEHDSVLLIEQFRIGPYAHGGSPWQIEIVAGIIHDDELPAQVARREALEEAGCVLGPQLLRIADYYMSPGAVSEHLTLFCAVTDLTGAGGIHGVAEEDEDIRVHSVPLDQALDWLHNGRIQNSPAIIALQWLALNRQRLRAFQP